MFYIFFADGFEEVEAIATIYVIRRAGIEIQSIGVGSKNIIGSHGITIICDKTIDDITPSDTLEGIILPGGMPGTTNLMENDAVNSFIDFCNEKNLYICAICAAPMILGRKGLFNGKKAVCFPGFESELSGAKTPDEYDCVDGKIITAKGMGSAVKFGVTIVGEIIGKEKAKNLESTLQCI